MNCFVVATTIAVAVLSSLGRDARLPLFYILASRAAAAALLLAYYVLRFFFRGNKSRSKHNFSQSIGTRIGMIYSAHSRYSFVPCSFAGEKCEEHKTPKWDKTIFEHDWMEVSRGGKVGGGGWAGERHYRTSGKLIAFMMSLWQFMWFANDLSVCACVRSRGCMSAYVSLFFCTFAVLPIRIMISSRPAWHLLIQTWNSVEQAPSDLRRSRCVFFRLRRSRSI